MTKWADYLISAVRFEETATTKQISHVKVHECKGEEMTSASTLSRESVIKHLDKGKTFRTMVMGNKGWEQGEKVFKIWIGDAYFIKTRPGHTANDNLDRLPVF